MGCLRQLHTALADEIEHLRAVTVAEVGAPVSLTYGGQLQMPVDSVAYIAGLGRIIAERTDFPPGTVNFITAADHGIGAQLTADPRVDLVSFTGSTATGRAVMAAAAGGRRTGAAASTSSRR